MKNARWDLLMKTVISMFIYGMGEGFYTISHGITAIEGKKAGLSLNQWVVDRFGADASLETVLNVIAANIILYAVRFGPYLLFNIPSALSGYINQYVHLSLVNPDIRSFYIPKVKTDNDMRKDYFSFNPLQFGLIELRKIIPIHIS